MLAESLSKYLSNVEAAVRRLEFAYVERYEEELVTPERVNLRIRMRFPTGHMLELNEAIFYEAGHVNHLAYRYHFQDRKTNLVFRYDNTPHFPDVNGFPHHKHLGDGVVGTSKPSIFQVIDEAAKSLG